ncbi:M10 family metallopeptidase C-terminal domain-containing protein [Brevundimonas sp.]|jgi:Ca2+-binding RTX toxin-like protein|uniref:calcium-binding protein n=1 Tax=Brevundimonas sp. TaxID=1871086 RepID=UPI0037852689
MPTFTGTGGADTLNGTSSDDVINGGIGGDRLSGLDGNDLLNGEDGNDTLLGGNGDDLLNGGAGDDVLLGGTGRNRLDGGTGGDDIAYYLEATTGLTISLAIADYQSTGYSIDQLVNIRHLVGSMNYGDTLIGSAGDDFLDPGSRWFSGDDPADFVYGGDGNDTISVQGVSNGDVLDGGAGDDIISLSFGTGSQTVYNTPGPQIYYAVAGDAPLVFGGTGNDRITIQSHGIVEGGAGDDVITVGVGHAYLLGSGRDWTYIVPPGVDTTVRVTGGSGADLFKVSNPVGVAVITDFQVGVDRVDLSDSYIGSFFSTPITYYQNGSDTVIADRTTPWIIFARLVGIDAASLPLGAIFSTRASVSMRSPFDLLTEGPDETHDGISVYGAGGDDRLFASDLGSTLAGGDGNDLLVGGAGVDALEGDAGDDILSGGAANDILNGDAGSDVLSGGAANDILNGGEGDDRLDGGIGNDALDGGTGTDTIDYSAVSGAVGVNLATGLAGGAAGSDTLNSFEIVIGSAFGDTVIGSRFADVLIGGRGSDILTGGTGADRFVYAIGDSTAVAADLITDFSTGSDKLDFTALGSVVVTLAPNGAGRTTVTAVDAAGGTTIVDVQGTVLFSDVIYTPIPAPMTLNGTSGQDTLVGGPLNDVLIGGGGRDTLTGGTGADIFRYLATSDSRVGALDAITDFETGIDLIDLTAINPTSVSTIRFAGGGSVVFAETPGGAFQLLAPIAGLNATDFLYNGTFGVYVVGSTDADTIIGSSRPDPLVGEGGDDTITGGVGADAISGGAGRDTFRYVTTADSSQLTGYDNLYDFTTGEDRIDLTVLAPSSISIIRSDNGSSFVFGQTEAGSFLTTADHRAVNGTDFIYGNGFGIYMIGSGVADVLIGSSLNDPIYAGAGNDTITGGGGADTLGGQDGADAFVYLAASDSTVAAADFIVDFVSGVDRIDLTAVRTSASDAFGIAWSGTGSFLFVDLGGDGVNEMLILLADVHLALSDILWTPVAIGEEPAVKDAGPQTLPGSDEIELVDTDMALDVSPHSGRYMLDLEGQRGFHGQDWYL